MPIKQLVPTNEHDTKQDIGNTVSILSCLMKSFDSLFPAQMGKQWGVSPTKLSWLLFDILERIVVAKQRDIEDDRRFRTKKPRLNPLVQ